MDTLHSLSSSRAALMATLTSILVALLAIAFFGGASGAFERAPDLRVAARTPSGHRRDYPRRRDRAPDRPPALAAMGGNACS